MARNINRLSPRAVVTATKPGRHADGGGLYLIVDKTGAKRWAFLFRKKGRLREMGLGGLNSVSLVEAREAAADCRRQLIKGVDPIAARKSALRVTPTFGEFADKFLEAKAPGWRSAKHHDQWKLAIERHAAPIRQHRIDEIDTEHVLEVLRPLWIGKRVTAARLRNRIEIVLDAAKAAGFRIGENPARLRGHLDHLLPGRQKVARAHFAALPYAEIPKLMAALRGAPTLAALGLEFLILTAARSFEVRGASWSEIDLSAKLWRLPPARMKAGREHKIPLSERCLEIMDEAKRLATSDLIFPGERLGKPIADTIWRKLLRRLGFVGVTVHGFRSSFRDWSGDQTSFPREVAEAALAHVVGDQTEAAYRRGDALEKRRALMNSWGRFCAHEPAEKVVALRR